MSLTFFYATDSSAITCHWALEELGIPYEKVRFDLRKGENHTSTFHALNPNEKVPTVVHDGVALFESAAIVTYLGETFGVERGLYPEPGQRRGEAMSWTVWTNASLHEALSRHLHASSAWVPSEQHNAAAAAAAKRDVEQHLAVLDERLATRPYVLGESFSLVDAHVGGWVLYAEMLGFALASYPNVRGWVDRCKARPACARAGAA